MKATVKIAKEFVFTHIELDVPMRYEDQQDEFQGMPGYDGKERRLRLILCLDTRTVIGWPQGKTADIHLKVTDEGTYELMAGARSWTLEDYVPDLIPGEYGDYIVMKVDEEGRVFEPDGYGGYYPWRPQLEDIRDFFMQLER